MSSSSSAPVGDGQLVQVDALPAAAALVAHLVAGRGVDEDFAAIASAAAPERSGRGCSIAADRRVADQAQDKPRGRERSGWSVWPGASRAEIDAGEPAQLGVEQREQRRGSLPVPGGDRVKDLG